ncbi:hypothetical protein GXW82_17090 [Streptacidiphilus sp. 4-A2]|nr:hypothetical protein [Streptacidiphilus sp. 4-A2]
MPDTQPRFEKVLVHSALLPALEEWLSANGIQLPRVNDIREGPRARPEGHPHGARIIRQRSR